MNYIKIPCWGAALSAPEFLQYVWPYDLRPDEWPTFCGAGEGLGDAIVPDSIRGVRISPACFIHDVEWAVSPDTFPEFMGANGRLFLNSAALIMASNLDTWPTIRALNRAMTAYLTAVSTVGILFFSWFAKRDELLNPLLHPVVKSRLKKIAAAQSKIAREVDDDAMLNDCGGMEI